MAHRQILTSPIRTPFPLNALQKIFLCTACKLYERLLGAKSGSWSSRRPLKIMVRFIGTFTVAIHH